jgi:hypothetical protein
VLAEPPVADYAAGFAHDVDIDLIAPVVDGSG